MSNDEPGRPFGLTLLAAAYFSFLLLTASTYGDPFPFMGRFYTGRPAEALVLADSLISLYLCLGILKQQRLTVWLLLGYNLLDIANACVNLALIPAADYARLAQVAVPEDELRLNTFVAATVLMLLNAYVLRNRRHFVNRSPYLF